MGIRLGAVVAAFAGVLIFASGAQAARGCPGKLPAKVNVPSSEVHEFERRAYVRVKPSGKKALKGVKVQVAFREVVLARGVVAGSLTGPENVALEFLEPLEAGRGYDVVVSGKLRGCGGSRTKAVNPVSFSDAGGGGSGGGGGDLPGPGANVQGLTVDWSGGKFEGADSAEVNLPGIGRAVAVCNPETTWLRVLPDDTNRSTAMLLYTYRESSFATFGSVREAVTTPFTGPDFNEGMNVDNPRPEATSKGTFTGVISDRLAFGATSGIGAPPTAVELSWQWNFAGGTESSCNVQANFTTEEPGSEAPLARSLIVNWRGDDAAPGNGAWTADVPGIGSARVDCQAGPSGIRRFTLFPEAGAGPATFTSYEGSDVNQTTQSQGPYRFELPNNGLVTADFGGSSAPDLFLSSRWKSNDPDASQNFCHLAGVLTTAR